MKYVTGAVICSDDVDCCWIITTTTTTSATGRSQGGARGALAP